MKRSLELSDAEVTHDLRARNSHIKSGIGRPLTPVFNAAADRIETFVDEVGGEMIAKLALARYPIDGPIDYSVATLPALLFYDTDHQTKVFHSDEEVDRHMKAFYEAYSPKFQQHPNVFTQYYDQKKGTHQHDVWTEELKSRLGERIDQEAWDNYLEHWLLQLGRGATNLDLVSARIARPANREFNRKHGLHIAATANEPTFLLSRTTALSSPVVSWNQLPVGENGPEDTARTMLAANFIVDFLSRDPYLTADLKEVKPSNVLRYHTLRARDSNVDQGSLVDYNREIIEEGALAVGAARNLLVLRQPPAYRSGVGNLHEDITRRRLVKTLTAVSGLSLIGGSMFYGYSVPDILQPNDGDKKHPHKFQSRLDFNQHALERLAVMRAISKRATYDEWHDYEHHGRYEGQLPPVRGGDGCPFVLRYGQKESTIDRFDRLLLKIREHIIVIPRRQELPETPTLMLPPLEDHARMIRANPGYVIL